MLRVVRGDDRRSWGILTGRFRRRIDPDRREQGFATWEPVHEPLRMRGVGGQASAVTDLEDRGGAAVVHIGWREIAEAAVMVRVDVPRKESAADTERVFEGADPVRTLR